MLNEFLMVAVERLPLQIFVGSVFQGFRARARTSSTRRLEPGLLLLRRMQRIFDDFQMALTRARSFFSVPIG